ncbi:MAG TPA: tetraacyldisaccharide 4'-kinase [Rhodanobacteraceae bacterium]|nr:tetraacyldisaccharide 4'-kinase [Rhodanobacteraceae bacterium]
MALADKLVRRWYDGGPRPWLLRPLTWLYRAVVSVRAWLYRHGWLASERLPAPVVVVGNITLGGTGKTPLVIALVEHLRRQGGRPGVVSRGYGGTQETPMLLPDKPDPARFGDEPCLIRQRTGVPVAVGRDRPAAARRLLEAGCDVVVADDGLQHYRLQRDVEICVIDGERRLGNGLMLPCGPLREPPSRLRRVDFRVCNGGETDNGEVPMQLTGDHARHLRNDEREQPLHAFTDRPVHAIAGIGNPARFFDSLRAQGLDVIEHPFPDHHAFARDDLDFGDDLPVLMTEKDAVKCAGFAHDRCWSVPARAVLPETFFSQLDQRLHNYPQASTPT